MYTKERNIPILFIFITALLLATALFTAGCGSGRSKAKIVVHLTDPSDLQLIQHKTDMYEIRVLDAQTGRGVPLVEFETIDGKYKYMTDSAGRIAINKPELMNKEVLFATKSHGYKAPLHKDHVHQYYMHGEIKLAVQPGKGDVIRIERINIAERLYRITGANIYWASVMLGYPVPIEKPLENAQVRGQDGGLGIVYKGQIHWLWGDTTRTNDPVTGQPRWGIFRAAGATSELPENGGLDPSEGVNLNYFTGPNGFVRNTHIIDNPQGMVWPAFIGIVDGRLLTYYNRRLADDKWTIVERGIAAFDDVKKEFRSIHTFDVDEEWRHPSTWGFLNIKENGIDWLYYGHPTFINKRVPATLDALKDTSKYEAWSCLASGSASDPHNATVLRDEKGRLVYRWTKDFHPIGSKEEKALMDAGKIQPYEAYFLPVDVNTGKRVVMHAGTVSWSPYRNRWIFIGVQDFGNPSLLGEVWYSEADSPTGPWKKAIKIITHDKYSFYNPSHLDFFDQEGGRIIYLNGCYSYSFSAPEPRDEDNDYNMVMYRLDLSDPRLQAVWD